MNELIETFGINWQLLLVQAVNFGVLLIALWWFLYRPVSRMIDERRAKIALGVEAAAEAQKKLGETLEERDGMLKAAVIESEKIVADARTVASLRADELVGDAEARADGIIRDATMRGEAREQEALKNSEKEIARAAVLAAEQILRQK